MAADTRCARRDSVHRGRLALVSVERSRCIPRHPHAPRAHQRIPSGANNRNANSSALWQGAGGDRALSRAEREPPRGPRSFDQVLRDLLSGNRALHVGGACNPDRHERIARQRRNTDRWNGRGISATEPKVLPATPGSCREIQHSADGDGELGKNLHAARHRAVDRSIRGDGGDEAFTRAGHGALRGCVVRVRCRPRCANRVRQAGCTGMGAQGSVVHCGAGAHARTRRTYRRREDNDREPADAILRSAARPHSREWSRYTDDAARRAARTDRVCAAGHFSLRGRCGDQHSPCEPDQR